MTEVEEFKSYYNEYCRLKNKKKTYEFENFDKEMELRSKCKEAFKKIDIKNQTEEICLIAVSLNGMLLEFVNHQTEDICLEALKMPPFNGSTESYGVEMMSPFKFVKDKTPKMCLVAATQYGGEDAFTYIKEQTPEICLEAVQNNGRILEYIKEQTLEICLEAIKNDSSAFQYVKDQTPEICLEAVRNNGYNLEFVKEQTPKLCLEAIKNTVGALQFVKEQTYELCL